MEQQGYNIQGNIRIDYPFNDLVCTEEYPGTDVVLPPRSGVRDSAVRTAWLILTDEFPAVRAKD